MKRVLVLMNSFNVGGVTSVAMAIYHGLNRADVTMDFIHDGQYKKNEIDEEVERNGDKIFLYKKPALNRIPVLNYSIQKRNIAKQILRQIRGIKYDAIHIHAHAHIGLYIAKKLRIPVRIMHVHEGIPDFGENVNKSFIMKYLWRKRQRQYNKWATVKAGDSLKACKAKFGEQVENDPKLCVLYPPVDMKKFDPATYGEETEIEKIVDSNVFNMIHVGRLVAVKNQPFLMDVLVEMNKIRATKLYIVGDGEQKEALLSYASVKGVKDKLHILPPDTSPAIYRKMDCSLLPSFSEAFGMVAVESQLMGVPCFASTNVPEDVNIGACRFLDLSKGTKYWAELILQEYKEMKIEPERAELFKVETLKEKVENLYGDTQKRV